MTQAAVWQEMLASLLAQLGRTADELASAGKSAEWKLALAAALKAQTTVTNYWLGETLYLGNLHEVSREVEEWTRGPEAARGQRSIKSTCAQLINVNPKAPRPGPVRLPVPVGEGPIVAAVAERYLAAMKPLLRIIIRLRLFAVAATTLEVLPMAEEGLS